MNTILSIKPLLAIGVSILAVPLILLFRNRPNIREGCTFLAALIKFGLVLSLLPWILDGKEVLFSLVRVLPEVGIEFRVDAFGLMFALVASFLWIVTSAYSVGYMRALNEHAQTRYFSFFAISLSATIGVAFSANLLTLYLCYEALSFATYPLVTHLQDEEAKKSGRKYLLYIVGASIGMVLPAMMIILHVAGTLDFSSHGIFPEGQNSSLIVVLLLMLVFGFAKAGIMPFHSWLPAAMVAPTPVSALLHAVAVVKVGVFCIVRMITGVFGRDLLLSLDIGTLVCYIASFTIIVASLIALSQDNLKSRLAFSTIGQLSYIVLGVALLSPQGMVGGMLHIVMHAFGKITLFFCAGAIFVATGVKSIRQMAGIGERMPVTMTCFFLGSLGVIGIPPAGGFLSKWYLALGTLQAGQPLMLAVLLASSVLNAAYFLPIVYQAFFCSGRASRFQNSSGEAPLWCLVPIAIAAFCSVLLLFYPQPFFQLAEIAVSHMTGLPR